MGINVNIQSSVVSDSLRRIKNVIKESDSVLSGVLIETDEASISLRGTNIDSTLEIDLPANILEQGIAVIPYKPLNDYINALGNEKINLKDVSKKNNYQLLISEIEGESKTKFNCLNHDDFPDTVKCDKLVCSMSIDNFLLMLKMVNKAAAKDISRPMLSCILLSIKDNSITFASMDGYRMHISKSPITTHTDCDLVIPASVLISLLGVLSSNGEDVSIYVNERGTLACFAQSNIRFTIRMFDGKYPAYQKLIDKSMARTRAFTIGAPQMKSAVNKVTAATKYDTKNPLQVTIMESDDEGTMVQLYSRGGEVTEDSVNKVLAVNTFRGPELVLQVSNNLLIDALEVLPADAVVEISAESVKSPITITAQIQDISFISVIMPVYQAGK